MYVTKEDFDNWNSKLKYIQFTERQKKSSEGEIWWCSLGINIGTEQNGTGHSLARPVLILKKIDRKSCYIVPLTTSTLNKKYRIGIGKIHDKDAKVLMDQIRVIDSKRLIEKITDIDPCMFLYVRETARKLF
jgi:mRNA-degrading endonuclease toxin of MazEF toxin-antitoxin module